MKVLITGASGLIGSALTAHLTARNQQVVRLVRRIPRPGAPEIFWDPSGGRIDADSLEGIDTVVHLAGQNLAAGRWTSARKKGIVASRIDATNLLVRTLISLRRPPQVMISASAIGYYGDRGAEILREDSGPGAGFLAKLCCQWESAASAVSSAGTRPVLLRLGMVLSKAGGALSRMLPAFRLGIGGKIGSGSQYMAWLAIDDLLGITDFVLHRPSLSGAFNAVVPHPITSLEFAKSLGRTLGRPAVFPVPRSAIRLMFGEMGEQVLLASARVVPARLIEAGYQFQYPELDGALSHILASQ